MSYSKSLVLVVLSMLASIASAAYAQPDIGNGGYNQELQTMEMMEMLDADGNHMVTKEEFNKYYNELFDTINKDKDDSLDTKEWVGTAKVKMTSLGTGGYISELSSMKMMEAMDSDSNSQVSRQEFLSFHEVLFNRMDVKGEGEVDAQNWLRKLTHN